MNSIRHTVPGDQSETQKHPVTNRTIEAALQSSIIGPADVIQQKTLDTEMIFVSASSVYSSGGTN
jgi:hypothetical protein